MGIYLNPGYENFREALSAPVYVDKSMMLDTLNRFMEQGNKYICVSRPRRFGKTLTQNMMAAYYSRGCDAENLFRDLEISGTERYEKYRNQLHVIQIDMNSEYQGAEIKENALKNLIRKIKSEFRQQFPDILFDPEDTLPDMMLRVYAERRETFAVLIDEYDVLIREEAPESLFQEYMGFLNALFKSNTLRPAISLAYITGILPVVRDKVQSKLNNVAEYTILDAKELAGAVGFTDKEVRALCDRYHVDYEECRRWYDGYRQHGMEIYNPQSVVACVTSGRFDDYWGKTSTYAVISDRIAANFQGMHDDVVRMLAGESVKVNAGRYMNTMRDFRNRSDAFTYLIHAGYLAYDLEDGTCRIPNREIRQEWIYALEDDAHYREKDQIIRDSEKLLRETQDGNERAVAAALDESHIHVTSNRSYNNEDVLQSAVCLAYIYALNEYTVIREMTAGKGFADVVFIPFRAGIPAMIIELKRNGSAESAITQIRQKRYFDSLKLYQGNLLFVGVNYDEKTKKHTCRIEKFVK